MIIIQEQDNMQSDECEEYLDIEDIKYTSLMGTMDSLGRLVETRLAIVLEKGKSKDA